MGWTRRRVLARGAVTAAAAVGASTVLATDALALPAVDMEMVLLASQVDPPKASTGLTPGASSHVIEVERALNAKGLLTSGAVDGTTARRRSRRTPPGNAPSATRASTPTAYPDPPR
jgi:hypothetical protein